MKMDYHAPLLLLLLTAERLLVQITSIASPRCNRRCHPAHVHADFKMATTRNLIHHRKLHPEVLLASQRVSQKVVHKHATTFITWRSKSVLTGTRDWRRISVWLRSSPSACRTISWEVTAVQLPQSPCNDIVKAKNYQMCSSHETRVKPRVSLVHRVPETRLRSRSRK
jgi:hypothetical protein